METDCLFLNDKIQKSLFYNGYFFAININNIDEKYINIVGKFKIDNNTKIFYKNIPYQDILIINNYAFISSKILKNNIKNNIIYIYICNNKSVINKDNCQFFDVKNLSEKVVLYYKKMFSTKIISKNKILQEYFNNILPKRILNNRQKIDYKTIFIYKDMAEDKLVQLYENSNLSDVDFYLLLKHFVFGINENDNTISLNPKTKNLLQVKFIDYIIDIKNENSQKQYFIIDDVKYYNTTSFKKDKKFNNFQITLVI